jgi:hypothetical protein
LLNETRTTTNERKKKKMAGFANYGYGKYGRDKYGANQYGINNDQANIHKLQKDFNKYAKAAQNLAQQIQAAKAGYSEDQFANNRAYKDLGRDSASEHSETFKKMRRHQDAENLQRANARKHHQDDLKHKNNAAKRAALQKDRARNKANVADKDQKAVRTADKNQKKRKRFHVRKFFEKKWEEDVANSADEREFLKDQRHAAAKAKALDNAKRNNAAHQNNAVAKARDNKAALAKAQRNDFDVDAANLYHSEDEKSIGKKDYKAAHANAAARKKDFDKAQYDKARKANKFNLGAANNHIGAGQFYDRDFDKYGRNAYAADAFGKGGYGSKGFAPGYGPGYYGYGPGYYGYGPDYYGYSYDDFGDLSNSNYYF